jgi:hypothetical protein
LKRSKIVPNHKSFQNLASFGYSHKSWRTSI